MNELALSDNLEILTDEILSFGQHINKSYWEIGRRLNYIKENDLVHGQFLNYLEKIKIQRDEAYKLMQIATLPNVATLQHLPKTSLFLIATLPDEEKQAQLDRVEQGDNPTVRELQEVRRQLKAKDEQLSLQAKMIEDLNEQEPQVIEKEVVVEKVPDDYGATKQLNSALLDKNKDLQRQYEDVKSRNDFVEMQLKDLYEQRAEVDEKSAKYDELTRAIEQSKGQLDEYQKSISAYKDVLNFLKKGNQFLSNFGGLVYVDIKPALANQQVKSELETFSVMLNSLAREVDSLLSQDNILEGEIL